MCISTGSYVQVIRSCNSFEAGLVVEVLRKVGDRIFVKHSGVSKSILAHDARKIDSDGKLI